MSDIIRKLSGLDSIRDREEIPAVHGFINKVYREESGRGRNGTWTRTDFDFEFVDGGKIKGSAWNPHRLDLQGFVGQEIIIESDGKNVLTLNEFKGKASLKLNGDVAIASVEGGESRERAAEEAPKRDRDPQPARREQAGASAPSKRGMADFALRHDYCLEWAEKRTRKLLGKTASDPLTAAEAAVVFQAASTLVISVDRCNVFPAPGSRFTPEGLKAATTAKPESSEVADAVRSAREATPEAAADPKSQDDQFPY